MLFVTRSLINLWAKLNCRCTGSNRKVGLGKSSYIKACRWSKECDV
ncbi:hypothetical protein G210_1414 [Candida maltosa Xu316]|uniref:Uncharacterized protein n=1 Tax=Candida maltosa (strain Xu316) TaxID=1245528 RepID=M3K0B9_CANMX|nr:hypothetical protein G210_1414 [Candida maltosa Xu316]